MMYRNGTTNPTNISDKNHFQEKLQTMQIIGIKTEKGSSEAGIGIAHSVAQLIGGLANGDILALSKVS